MLDKLEFFIALAQEQHFGRAAEACRVSQPSAMSKPAARVCNPLSAGPLSN